MDKAIPRFERRVNSGGSVQIRFVTLTHDGKLVRMTLWDLVNKHGADEVLRMRERYPEIEVEK